MKHSVYVLDDQSDTLSVIHDIVDAGWQEDSFFVADVSEIVRKYDEFIAYLPRVKPYYAVKCNDHWSVLETFAALGLGFDCASMCELQAVTALGVDASRIIYAHPTKPHKHLKFAAKHHFDLITFDNESELHKIKDLHPNAKLVIRIKTDAKDVLHDLSKKFGCDPVSEAPHLLVTCKDLGLDVVGVAFHVGSGCREIDSFSRAVKAARRVFDLGKQLGYEFKLLDIGGGFPGEKGSSIKEFAEVINKAINEDFSDLSVKIIAEPGQYFVLSAFTVVCNVQSMKSTKLQRAKGISEETSKEDLTSSGEETTMIYYINDGLFNSFSVNDPDPVTCVPLKIRENVATFDSIIWGQTCASLDIVIRNQRLPEMRVGDWVYFKNMGAYTLAHTSKFNGFTAAKVLTTLDQKTWLRLKEVFSQDRQWNKASPKQILNNSTPKCE